jgi:hypothetical protein
MNTQYLSYSIWTRRLTEYIKENPIKAPSAKTGSLGAVVILSLSVPGYLIIGCSTDWVVVSGFVVDIVGATILAVPDLPIYDEYTYGGRVRQAYLRMTQDEQNGRIAPETRYYDCFRSALRERLPPQDFPEGAYFDIEYRPTGEVFYIKDETLNVQKVSKLGNIERVLTDVYESREGDFRRLGISFLIIGFLAQLLGMAVDTVYGLPIC